MGAREQVRHLLVFVTDCTLDLVVELVDIVSISLQRLVVLEQHFGVGVIVLEECKSLSLVLGHFVGNIQLEELCFLGEFGHSIPFLSDILHLDEFASFSFSTFGRLCEIGIKFRDFDRIDVNVGHLHVASVVEGVLGGEGELPALPSFVLLYLLRALSI